MLAWSGMPSRLLLVAAASAAVFAAIAVLVMPSGRPVELDVAVLDWIVAHRSDPATTVLGAVTWIGSILALVPLIGLVVVALYRRRGLAPVRWLAIDVVGINVLHVLFTQIFVRPRPPLGLRLYGETSWSFPSGHASQAVALAIMIAVVVGEGGSRRTRRAWFIAAAGYTLLVGFSRIYLGAHWTTDVLGGFALGIAWVAAVLACRSWLRARAR